MALTVGFLSFWYEKAIALLFLFWFKKKVAAKFLNKLSGFPSFLISSVSAIFIYVLGFNFSSRITTYFNNFGVGDVLESMGISVLLGAFLAYFLFMISLSLFLSSVKPLVILRKEYNILVKRVDKLEGLVKRLVDSTSAKHILEDKITKSEALDFVKAYVKKKGYDSDFKVIKEFHENGFYVVDITFEYRSFRIKMEELSGNVVDFYHLTDNPKNVALSIITYFQNNTKSLVGFLFFFSLILYSVFMINPVVKQDLTTLTNFEYNSVNDSTLDLGESFSGLFGLSGTLDGNGLYDESVLQGLQ